MGLRNIPNVRATHFNETVVITGNCRVTGKEVSTPPIITSQLAAWQNGELMQAAMPNLEPEWREFLISGTSPEGWKVLFPEGDDVDEQDDEEWVANG